jgi:hypothetical protein
MGWSEEGMMLGINHGKRARSIVEDRQKGDSAEQSDGAVERIDS